MVVYVGSVVVVVFVVYVGSVGSCCCGGVCG